MPMWVSFALHRKFARKDRTAFFHFNGKNCSSATNRYLDTEFEKKHYEFKKIDDSLSLISQSKLQLLTSKLPAKAAGYIFPVFCADNVSRFFENFMELKFRNKVYECHVTRYAMKMVHTCLFVKSCTKTDWQLKEWLNCITIVCTGRRFGSSKNKGFKIQGWEFRRECEIRPICLLRYICKVIRCICKMIRWICEKIRPIANNKTFFKICLSKYLLAKCFSKFTSLYIHYSIRLMILMRPVYKTNANPCCFANLSYWSANPSYHFCKSVLSFYLMQILHPCPVWLMS